MTIKEITNEKIEFFNKNGRKNISIANETGSIQIVRLENIERLRNFLNELEETKYNMRDPFLQKKI